MVKGSLGLGVGTDKSARPTGAQAGGWPACVGQAGTLGSPGSGWGGDHPWHLHTHGGAGLRPRRPGSEALALEEARAGVWPAVPPRMALKSVAWGQAGAPGRMHGGAPPRSALPGAPLVPQLVLWGHRDCFLKKKKILFFTESKLFFLFLYHFSDVIFTFALILICRSGERFGGLALVTPS